jgi:TldD protein
LPGHIDPGFTALPSRSLADAALTRIRELAREAGVDGPDLAADFRLEQIRTQSLSLRDGVTESSNDDEDIGFAVRVVLDGTWGFAAGVDLTPEAAVLVAERAVEVAQLAKSLATERVELAPEPSHGEVVWIADYERDPIEVPDAEKIALLADWSQRVLADPRVSHVDASVEAVRENKFYADLAGTVAVQQRVRVHPVVTAIRVDPDTGDFESMRTLAAPAGQGWEYLTALRWDADLAELPDLLVAKMAAPSVEPGTYDLVIDPTNLWLTIHESVGHATELDRALGYEANYAGTSFATPDKLNTLQYGSAAMHVTGDRTIPNGLATIGYDDEGVATGQFDIVKEGLLVGYQLDRRIAARQGLDRSNGCAFADSPGHVPIQRMANVSLQPAADGPSTAALISRVERGIYIVGDNSWSIDMQRYNFQFTGQRFFLIENGQLAGQLRDVAYQATTTDFWGSLEAVGGPQTWVLGGAMNCGKGQPGQVAPVSHGCPSALFRSVNVLNTRTEAG